VGRPANTREFVLESLEVEYVSDCVEVSNYKRTSKGYYQVRVDGKRTYLHIVVFEDQHGSMQPGEVVRHTCDNPGCINIAHLICGSYADNMADMHERNRGIRLGYELITCKRGHNLALPGAIATVARKGRNDSQQCVECRKLREAR
jgi:hypothetical protein